MYHNILQGAYTNYISMTDYCYTELIAQLRRLNSEVEVTFHDRQYEEHSLLYTEDCSVMTPGFPTATGREGI